MECMEHLPYREEAWSRHPWLAWDLDPRFLSLGSSLLHHLQALLLPLALFLDNSSLNSNKISELPV
jgi:hypothetical protein